MVLVSGVEDCDHEGYGLYVWCECLGASVVDEFDHTAADLVWARESGEQDLGF